MPDKIPGQRGSWYAPGTRKGNVTIVWRGQLPDGTWTELVTDSAHQSGAQSHLQRFLEAWHRDRPPAQGERVSLDAAAHHYKAAACRSDFERDRVDRLVRYLGKETDVAAVNQTHVTLAAGKFRAERTQRNELAAMKKPPGQIFPPPSTETVNREITTPLRAIVNFAAGQAWRHKIVLKAVKRASGELPSLPRRAAQDGDVDKLLRAISQALEDLKPVGRRQLNYRRKLASLRALFALVTVVHERGYRISEWLRWDWTTIDLQAGMARILLSKPDRWADFDLSPQAVAALAAMPAKDAGRVFPWRHRSQVYQAVDRLGLHWRPHESRRAVVTAVLKNTGDPRLAQEYVGHASVRTTLRYRVVDQDELGPQARTVRGGAGRKEPSR